MLCGDRSSPERAAQLFIFRTCPTARFDCVFTSDFALAGRTSLVKDAFAYTSEVSIHHGCIAALPALDRRAEQAAPMGDIIERVWP